MMLLIDNYDSFSYNLVQLLGSLGGDMKTVRNDKITVEEIAALNPEAIILSPGPGRPAEAGICETVVRQFQGQIPIMGVCLGHQAICEVYGMKITYAKQLMHGKQSRLKRNDDVLFNGLPGDIPVARYHSLAADPETLPECLEVIAKDQEQGEIMAVKHKEYLIYGLQFHPESILTPDGSQIVRNFLKTAKIGGL